MISNEALSSIILFLIYFTPIIVFLGLSINIIFAIRNYIELKKVLKKL